MDKWQIDMGTVRQQLTGFDGGNALSLTALNALEAWGVRVTCWADDQMRYQLRAELDGEMVETQLQREITFAMTVELQNLTLPLVNARRN
ncbi:hypothetical protein [Deinococcus alpinitundrae]|uniref:hypothetical protein n=1 Tax=Deinococcus alpinitundrae TaxID=468913 RepID=UPI001379BE05|nr:hypothetical protein [Deinococcus alpinitundrae]